MSSAYVCLAIKELPVLYTSYKCLYLAQPIVFSYVCTLTLASAIAFITWPCILYREASFLKLTTFVHKRYFSQSIFECLLVLTCFFFFYSQNVILEEGERYAGLLYTWRSLSRAVPAVSLSIQIKL